MIIKDVIFVLTDYSHVAGFKLQSQILQQLIQIIDQGLVGENLLTEEGSPHGYTSNKEFVVQLLIFIINNLFANLNKTQIEAFVWKLFNHCGQWNDFKNTVRDLLVSMKSFSSSDDDFYAEEKKVALEEAQRKEQERRNAIPGMVKSGEPPSLNGAAY